MAFTETETLRIQAIESKLNELQTSSNNLSTRREVKNLFAILNNVLEALKVEVAQIELTGSGNALVNHKIDPDAHPQLDDRYFTKTSYITVGTGSGDVGKPIVLNSSGEVDSSVLPASFGGGVTDHGALTGLLDDDHTQYHTDARALTWLGTRSTTDLPQGSNKYYTEAAVSANTTVQSGISNVHARTHAVDSVADHQAAFSANWGKFVRANPSTGVIEFVTLDDTTIPDTISLTNITQVTNRSHTDLSNIGTNTHAQIDTALASLTAVLASYVSSFNGRTGTVTLVTGDAPAGSGTNSIQWGVGASATATGAIAIGITPQAVVTDGIAIGTNAYAAVDSYAISIGSGSRAWGLNSTALGVSAAATAQSATAIGGGSAAAGIQAVAVGSSSDSQGTNTIAIGHDSFTGPTSTGAIALGRTASSTAVDAISLGNGATVAGQSSIAIGAGATIGAYTNALAIGAAATVTANNEGQIGTAAQPISLKTYSNLNIGGALTTNTAGGLIATSLSSPTMFQDPASAGAYITVRSHSQNAGGYLFETGGGVVNSPTHINSGTTSLNLVSRGWNGSAWANGAAIQARASQDWTTSAQGMNIAFMTVPSNSTTLADRWEISPEGVLKASTDNTYDIGASGASRPKDLYLAGNLTLGGTVSTSSGIFNHNLLSGLGNDDHTQYHNDARAVTWLGAAASGILNHNHLAGLNNDDHTQYLNESRALTWLGTRSTTDLSEGSRLYYTDARVTANTTVQSGIIEVHNRGHQQDSLADHLATDSGNYGKFLRANLSTGYTEYSTLSGLFNGDIDLNGNYLYTSGTDANGAIHYFPSQKSVAFGMKADSPSTGRGVLIGMFGNALGVNGDYNNLSGWQILEFGDIGLCGNSSHLANINTVDSSRNDTTFELGGGITDKVGDGFTIYNCGSFSGSTDEMSLSSSGVQRFVHMATEVNQSSTASFVGLRLEMNPRSQGTGYHRLMDLGTTSGISGQLIGVSAQNGTGEGLYNPRLIVDTAGAIALATDAGVNWSSTYDASGTADVGLSHTASGVLKVTNGSTGTGTIVAAVTGNASTATTLQTARTIAGTSFDGSANITPNHSGLAALTTGDDHTQYALLAGRSGGQTLIGGTANSNNLQLQSTSGSTKGSVLIGTSAYDETNNRLGLLTTAPTHTLTLNNTAQWAHYNIAVDPTNYERAVGFWTSNVYVIQSQAGGSGSSRSIEVVSNDGSGFRCDDFGGLSLLGSSAGFVSTLAPDGVGQSIVGRLTSNNQANIRLNNGTFGTPYSSSDGSQQAVQINATVNQTSTASYTSLELNNTMTTSGTGNRRIFDGKVNTLSKFYIDNTGDVTASGNLSFLGQIAPINTPLINTGLAQTVDWNNGNFQILKLAAGSGNVTLTLVNPLPGARYSIKVIQRAASAANISWPNTVKWPGGTAPTISVGASAVDMIYLDFDGTNYYGRFSQNFS